MSKSPETSSNGLPIEQPPSSSRVRGNQRRWIVWRVLQGLVALPLLYALILLIGLVPVNNQFQPASDGVEIQVISTAVHADIILPLVTDEFDWREHIPASLFSGDANLATHIAVGWGDRGFFLETPTWSDLTFSTAARALLWPSDSCLHVTMTRAEYWRDEGRVIRISPEQHRKLIEFILSWFKMDEQGRFLVIPEITYSDDDVFLEAHGHYHCLNTCNSWVGQAMRHAGIRTPWLTPLPKTMFLWLPSSAEGNEAP